MGFSTVSKPIPIPTFPLKGKEFAITGAPSIDRGSKDARMAPMGSFHPQ